MPGIQILISTPALLKKTGIEEGREEEQKEVGRKGRKKQKEEGEG